MKDPKFGYHAFWILPLALAFGVYEETAKTIGRFQHNRKMKKIKEDPDISELSRLSGIKD